MSFITEHWDESAYELALKWLYSNFVATRKAPKAPSGVTTFPRTLLAPFQGTNLPCVYLQVVNWHTSDLVTLLFQMFTSHQVVAELIH